MAVDSIIIWGSAGGWAAFAPAYALALARELALFAGVVFLIFALGDILLDIGWLVFRPSRAGAPVAADTKVDGLALFIPAWHEGAVIGDMLAHACGAWHQSAVRFYVGVYPNDVLSHVVAIGAARRDARVRIIRVGAPGPTSKGDCLNALWRALKSDVARGDFVCRAVAFHDAEDRVDPLEPQLYAAELAHADAVQIPVLPLPRRGARLIAGHYLDEFALSHRRDMPLRARLGAPMPFAGVGFAVRFALLDLLSMRRGGTPFAADSLTEDYELGMELAAMGARSIFVERHDYDGRLIASRAYFPDTIDGAVRQKTRWMQGIALDGWDRLGWAASGGHRRPSAILGGLWMLWRDRRAPLAAAAIFAAYLALLLTLLAWGWGAWHGTAINLPVGDHMRLLVALNLLLLLWRGVFRAWHSGARYGWAEAALALARIPIANIILVMSAWRALWRYARARRGRATLWDKTAHIFPMAEAELA